jgi:hypothetical protein
MELPEFVAATGEPVPEWVRCQGCGFLREVGRFRNVADRLPDATGGREEFAEVLPLLPFVCDACVSRVDRELVAAAVAIDRAADAPEPIGGPDFSAVISQRNHLLNACLWAVLDIDDGTRITPEQREAWMAYRRALNAIPLGKETPEEALAALEALKAPL